jgi:RNA polymerase sigma-70 factor (ECF subfamily)
VSDAELVARARQGDAGAFGELVDRHRIAVYRAALAALGSHAEAEDAAQDAFFVAWKRLASFRAEASFKTWMLTIAWHQAINRRRSLTQWWKRAMSISDRSGFSRLHQERLEATSRERSPEQAAADAELRRALAAAIRALPLKLRDTLLLAQAGEYSYEEIAAMLRAPVGTIKWRVSEARRVIKASMRARGFEDVETAAR